MTGESTGVYRFVVAGEGGVAQRDITAARRKAWRLFSPFRVLTRAAVPIRDTLHTYFARVPTGVKTTLTALGARIAGHTGSKIVRGLGREQVATQPPIAWGRAGRITGVNPAGLAPRPRSARWQPAAVAKLTLPNSGADAVALGVASDAGAPIFAGAAGATAADAHLTEEGLFDAPAYDGVASSHLAAVSTPTPAAFLPGLAVYLHTDVGRIADGSHITAAHRGASAPNGA